MSYAVFFRSGGTRYRLPVNPEEIRRRRKMNIEKYQVLGSGQVSVPTCCELEEFSFEAEFPGREYPYVETAGKFRDADYYEKLFRRAQKKQIPLRFIASNGITDDISTLVLVESIESVEKAGEEGDKYLTLKLLEYQAPATAYIGVESRGELVLQEQTAAEENPAVTENKTHTVGAGDTLWSIAKTYYGDGSLYKKIVAVNPGIRNPNLISEGQILSIPMQEVTGWS